MRKTNASEEKRAITRKHVSCDSKDNDCVRKTMSIVWDWLSKFQTLNTQLNSSSITSEKTLTVAKMLLERWEWWMVSNRISKCSRMWSLTWQRGKEFWALLQKGTTRLSSAIKGMKKDLDKARTLLWGRYQLTLHDRIEAQNRLETAIRKKSCWATFGN